jgi:hypothetical protein
MSSSAAANAGPDAQDQHCGQVFALVQPGNIETSNRIVFTRAISRSACVSNRYKSATIGEPICVERFDVHECWTPRALTGRGRGKLDPPDLDHTTCS